MKNIRNDREKNISIILMLMMVLQMMMPVSFAYGEETLNNIDTAEDIVSEGIVANTTSGSGIGGTPSLPEGGADPDAISGITVNIEFRDRDGKVIDHKTNTVPADARVKLNIGLEITDMDNSGNGVVDTSKDYIIKIADEISISKDETIDLMYNGESVGTAVIGKNGTITVRFNGNINKYTEDRTAWLEANGGLDESVLGQGGDRTLEFEVDGKTERIEIKVEEIENEETVTLNKTGSYNESKNEITWTVTVTAKTIPHGGKIKNVKIQDTVRDGHTYVKHIIDNIEYTTLSDFIFEEMKDGETKTIKVITRPDLSQIDADKQGKDVVFINTVNGSFGAENEIPQAEASVKTKIEFINKHNVSYDPTNRDTIAWTIVLNKNYLDMPAGTTLTDEIPKGLKLEGEVTMSPAIEGAKVTKAEDGSGFTIVFEQGLSKKVTVSYKTKITDKNAYEPNEPVSYVNKAQLEWGNDQKAEDTGTVGIGRTVIGKERAGYNSSNHTIQWKIRVNKDRLNIVNPVVTDTLPKELEYVSYSMGEGTEDIWGEPELGTDAEGRQTITFTHEGTIDEMYLIQLTTKVKDEYRNIYGANKNTNFTNKVTLKGENLTEKSATVTETYKSTVIAKTGTGYDYVNRKATWKITVNQNKMLIKNAVITDVIGMHHDFVPGSLKINGESAEGKYTVSEDGKTLTTTLGEINDVMVVTYETQIPEEQLKILFEKNGSPELENNATITGDEIKDGRETIKGKQQINNTVVGKKANYTPGEDSIEWVVEVNLNQVNFGEVDVELEDKLQDGLILDKKSVKLYGLEMKADGTYNIGSESDKVTVDYDTITNNVIFNLGKVDNAYLLKFRTDIAGDSADKVIKNTITLKGYSDKDNSSEASIPVKFDNSTGGASGSNTRGSIRIIKNDDLGTPIKGVEFELLGANDKKFGSGFTDEDGILEFGDLLMGTYYIKETNTPDGYVKLDENTMIVLKKGFDGEIDLKHQEVVIVNEKIREGEINVIKVDGSDRLPGAEFGIYRNGGDTPVKTAVSDNGGVVAFKNMTAGEYLIKEIKAPEGYVKSEAVIYVRVVKDGVGLKAEYSKDGKEYSADVPEFENNSIDIVLKKKDENNNSLQGAEFTLYDEDGTTVFENRKAVKSNDDGKVVFKAVPAGKYIIKETKAPAGYNGFDKAIAAEVKADGTFVLTVGGEVLDDNTVINERKPETPEKPEKPEKPVEPKKPETPDNPNNETIDETDVPLDGGEEEIINEPEVPEGTTNLGDKLPNTGYILNTWMLTAIGFIFILTGAFTFRKKEEQAEEL